MTLDILPFRSIIAERGLNPLALVPEESSLQERPTSSQLREAWRLVNARREQARPLNSIFVDNVLEQTHDDAEEIVMQQVGILQDIEDGVYGPEHAQEVEAEWRQLRKRGKAKKNRRADQLRAMLEADAIAVEKEEEDEAASQAIQPAALPPLPPRYPMPKAPSGPRNYPQRPMMHLPDLTLRNPRGLARKLRPTATLKRQQVQLVEKLGLDSSELPCASVYDRSYEDELRALAQKRKKEKEEAAVRAIQIRWKYYRLRTYMLLINATLTCAAEVIQYWWRMKLEQRRDKIVQTWLSTLYNRAEPIASTQKTVRRLSNEVLASVYSTTIAEVLR